MAHQHGPRPRALAAAALAGLVLLTACGDAPGPAGSSPSASATVACPAPLDADPPPGCVPYDPEHAMEQNERYRDRMPLDEEARAGNTAALEDVTTALKGLAGADAPVTEEEVEDAVAGAGLEHVRTRGDGLGGVLFGGGAPAGGCVHGGVTQDGVVSAEVAGVILDGGCLPAH